MPSSEDQRLYTDPDSAALHSRSNSLTSLARLPGVARAKLAHLAQQAPFVRFMEDNDGMDKDENEIYRIKQHVRSRRRRAACSIPFLAFPPRAVHHPGGGAQPAAAGVPACLPSVTPATQPPAARCSPCPTTPPTAVWGPGVHV